jgi:hypothetical protein
MRLSAAKSISRSISLPDDTDGSRTSLTSLFTSLRSLSWPCVDFKRLRWTDRDLEVADVGRTSELFSCLPKCAHGVACLGRARAPSRTSHCLVVPLDGTRPVRAHRPRSAAAVWAWALQDVHECTNRPSNRGVASPHSALTTARLSSVRPRVRQGRTEGRSARLRRIRHRHRPSADHRRAHRSSQLFGEQHRLAKEA